MTNRYSFLNGISVNGDCVVGMNLNNGKGTLADKVKFVRTGVIVNVNFVTDFEFMPRATAIGVKEATINECLSVFGKS